MSKKEVIKRLEKLLEKLEEIRYNNTKHVPNMLRLPNFAMRPYKKKRV